MTSKGIRDPSPLPLNDPFELLTQQFIDCSIGLKYLKGHAVRCRKSSRQVLQGLYLASIYAYEQDIEMTDFIVHTFQSTLTMTQLMVKFEYDMTQETINDIHTLMMAYRTIFSEVEQKKEMGFHSSPTVALLNKMHILLTFGFYFKGGRFRTDPFKEYPEGTRCAVSKIQDALIHIFEVIDFFWEESNSFRERLRLAAFFIERFSYVCPYKNMNYAVGQFMVSYIMYDFCPFPLPIVNVNQDSFGETKKVFQQIMRRVLNVNGVHKSHKEEVWGGFASEELMRYLITSFSDTLKRPFLRYGKFSNLPMSLASLTVDHEEETEVF